MSSGVWFFWDPSEWGKDRDGPRVESIITWMCSPSLDPSLTCRAVHCLVSWGKPVVFLRSVFAVIMLVSVSHVSSTSSSGGNGLLAEGGTNNVVTSMQQCSLKQKISNAIVWTILTAQGQWVRSELENLAGMVAEGVADRHKPNIVAEWAVWSIRWCTVKRVQKDLGALSAHNVSHWTHILQPRTVKSQVSCPFACWINRSFNHSQHIVSHTVYYITGRARFVLDHSQSRTQSLTM